MTNKTIGPLGLLITLFSCSTMDNKVIVTEYSWDKQTIKNKSTLNLNIEQTDSFIKYHMTDSNSVETGFAFDKPINTDSIVYMADIKMKLVDTKKYTIGKTPHEILKYEFKDGTDGDMTLFLDKNYGPIILRSDSWGGFITFDKPRQQGQELIEKIKMDSLRFGGV